MTSINKSARTSTRKSRKLLPAAALAASMALAFTTSMVLPTNVSEAQESPAPVGPSVIVAQPTVKSITEWDTYTGRFEAIDNVSIRARVSGYLTNIAFTDGDIVQKGDLLFRIDPRPFEAQLLAAQAAVAQAQAARDNAFDEASRGERLLKQNAISAEEAQRRERTLLQTDAALAAAKAQQKTAELNLEFTEVRAPVTGRVSDNFVSEGNLIVGGANGGTVLTTLVSTNPIYFEFTASEADYLKYVRLDTEGSRTSGRDEAHPVRVKLMDEKEFGHYGSLSFVDNQIDRSTGTMRGRATFDNTNGTFAPGMFGRLQLKGSGEYQAVMVPDTAVQTDQSEKFVWIADDNNVAKPVTVTLGPIVEGLRVVRSGLDGDERLIVSGTQFVQANNPVVPQEADGEATQLVAGQL